MVYVFYEPAEWLICFAKLYKSNKLAGRIGKLGSGVTIHFLEIFND